MSAEAVQLAGARQALEAWAAAKDHLYRSLEQHASNDDLQAAVDRIREAEEGLRLALGQLRGAPVDYYGAGQEQEAAPVEDRSGTAAIALERQRMIDGENRTGEQDAPFERGELAAAGASYALLNTAWKGSTLVDDPLIHRLMWPWERGWFRPVSYGPSFGSEREIGQRQKELARAGALIAAEYDRLERLKELP